MWNGDDAMPRVLVSRMDQCARRPCRLLPGLCSAGCRARPRDRPGVNAQFIPVQAQFGGPILWLVERTARGDVYVAVSSSIYGREELLPHGAFHNRALATVTTRGRSLFRVETALVQEPPLRPIWAGPPSMPLQPPSISCQALRARLHRAVADQQVDYIDLGPHRGTQRTPVATPDAPGPVSQVLG
jgi:hypothetical protein